MKKIAFCVLIGLCFATIYNCKSINVNPKSINVNPKSINVNYTEPDSMIIQTKVDSVVKIDEN